ncbi:RNA-directed DNA polymerase [Rhizobium leguminosarum]|uniref:RNA-directed DNA polymerase n=1 Tax=Rhizobium leguminosarum TaxID=384 RepID=UPI003F94CB2D
MMEVKREHFARAASEIGKSGDNDTLPYDIDSSFVRDQAEGLAQLCFELFTLLDNKSFKDAKNFINELTVGSERLLVPSGSHGFRITTKLHPFWNLYLNGIGLAIAETNEPQRSHRVHSYRLDASKSSYFDPSRSWRAYRESTLQEPELQREGAIVVQTDVSSFYEHIYHHRLENLIKDLSRSNSTVAAQVDRILNQLTAGRSFGLPVGGQGARVLAEVMMTPIDQILTEKGIVWHRYVDDFTLMCASQQDAYSALSVLSHALADYGLTLNRSKTTFLSATHYVDYVRAQLGEGEEASTTLRELDLHFDPYSDTAQTEYETLKESFANIDIQFLLDLEKEKSQPDSFVLAQIGRALKFQEPQVAVQLCATLLDARNLNSFRASWSKIMRGVFSVRANEEFAAVFSQIDSLLDSVPVVAPHLLIPEANLLHYLRAIRFNKTPLRASLVRQAYDTQKSQSVKRACIECWGHWEDRANFMTLRNDWQNLGADEQRTFWLISKKFGDEGEYARQQLRKSLNQAWRLGFENGAGSSFASCYLEWIRNVQ